MEVKDNGLPDPQGRDAQDPAAAVPGGELLRRHDSRGRPRRRTIGDGDTIPVTQTAYPVQLDQILTVAPVGHSQGPPGPARGLRHGAHARRRPRRGRRRRTPTSRASPARRRSTTRCATGAPALKHAAQVQQGLPRDRAARPAKLVAGLQKTVGGPRPERGAAQGLLHELQPHDDRAGRRSRTTCARRSGCSARRSRRRTPTSATSPTALPPTREFVRGFIPGVQRDARDDHGGGAVARPSSPRSCRKPELGGLLTDLRPMTASFAQGRLRVDRLQQADRPDQPLLLQRHPAERRRRAPGRGGERPAPRPSRSSGTRSSGLPGESQNFDGNGQYTRVQTGGGPTRRQERRSCRARRRVDTQLFGNAIAAAARHAARPARPRSRRTSRTAACYKNAAPEPERPRREGRAAGRRRSRSSDKSDPETPPGLHRDHRHGRAGAVASPATSSSHQRFYLPGWVPVLGTDFFELKGEFQTAQSVMPGQGQTVDIAGVPVGDVKKRRAEGRPRGHHDDRPQKYAQDDQQGRVHAAAAEDRAQRHDRRADPRHRLGAETWRTATRSRSATRFRTSTWTSSSRRSTATRATT